MDAKPTTHEQETSTHDMMEGSRMELTRSQELIRQLKETKTRNEITYPRIMDRIEKNGKFVSLTTLRRVFADGSELNADSFSYENTLMPIAEALLNVEDVPTASDSPYAKEIDGLKSVIHVQNEEIARLHELKEHLESRISFLLAQIEKKDERMDRKDRIIDDKDAIIKDKDELIKQLMSKCM